MCCCPKPSINGEPNAYSWDGKSLSTRAPVFAALKDSDELLYELPGRCGGMDSHCHDLRVVKNHGSYALLVHNGSGDHRLSLGRGRDIIEVIDALADDAARYWFLIRFNHLLNDAVWAAKEERDAVWRKAAAEKRIKTRKLPGKGLVKVWVEAEKLTA